MSDGAEPVYDCLLCGACCASQSPGESYVLVNEADVRRLAGRLPILTIDVQDADPPEQIQALPTKRDPNGTKVCVGLNGCAGGANACSVYEYRPRACRVYEVDSIFCREARQHFGFPVRELPGDV